MRQWGGAALVIAAVTVAAPRGSTQAQHVLDLTRRIPPETAGGHVGSGCGAAGQEGEFSPVLPLRLTLLSLDRGEYEFGARLSYHIRIENVGIDPVAIPWRPCWEEQAELTSVLDAFVNLSAPGTSGSKDYDLTATWL